MKQKRKNENCLQKSEQVFLTGHNPAKTSKNTDSKTPNKPTRKPAKKVASKAKTKTVDNDQKSSEDNKSSTTKPDEKPS